MHYPLALYLLLDDHPEFFDAILVDEAQDFGEEFWLPVQIMLKSEKDSPFYLFYDFNQRVYSRNNGFPIRPEEDFHLTVNCRNTKSIHAFVAKFHSGTEYDQPAIDGKEIEWHGVEGHPQQAEKITGLVTDYLINGGLSPQDIVVLVTDRRILLSLIEALARRPLPKGIQWSEVTEPQNNRVRVVTAARFKGLEASVCIQWGLDTIDMERDKMDVYVGASRPRNRLHVIASRDRIASLRGQL